MQLVRESQRKKQKQKQKQIERERERGRTATLVAAEAHGRVLSAQPLSPHTSRQHHALRASAAVRAPHTPAPHSAGSSAIRHSGQVVHRTLAAPPDLA